MGLILLFYTAPAIAVPTRLVREHARFVGYGFAARVVEACGHHAFHEERDFLSRGGYILLLHIE